MNQAVTTKLNNLELNLHDTLVLRGFNYPRIDENNKLSK